MMVGLRPAFKAFGLDKGRITKRGKNGTAILTASPTAPSPNIATVEPGVTSATFQAAPIPASPSFQTLTPSITFPRFANGSGWDGTMLHIKRILDPNKMKDSIIRVLGMGS